MPRRPSRLFPLQNHQEGNFARTKSFGEHQPDSAPLSYPTPFSRTSSLSINASSSSSGFKNSLAPQGTKFSTSDMDNDNCICRCAQMMSGGGCAQMMSGGGCIQMMSGGGCVQMTSAQMTSGGGGGYVQMMSGGGCVQMIPGGRCTQITSCGGGGRVCSDAIWRWALLVRL